MHSMRDEHEGDDKTWVYFLLTLGMCSMEVIEKGQYGFRDTNCFLMLNLCLISIDIVLYL